MNNTGISCYSVKLLNKEKRTIKGPEKTSETVHTFSELSPNTEYYFEVAGASKTFLGPYYQEKVFTGMG